VPCLPADGVDLATMAAVPVVYGTAELALRHRAQLKPGRLPRLLWWQAGKLPPARGLWWWHAATCQGAVVLSLAAVSIALQAVRHM
jgi:hypothetical protein